nr:family 20 glycosylhydrolase [Chryseolinea sp.]
MNYQKQSSSLFFTLFIVCFCMVLSSCNTSKPTSPEAAEALQSIIPKPTSVEATGETFILSEASGIFVEGGSEEVLLIGKYLSDRLKTATGFELPISVSESNGEQAKGNILLTLAGADASLGDEGYTLTITGKSIILAANKSAGLFRGIQTIRQLLPAKVELSSKQEGPWEIATAAIRDLPSYSYRGSMLDVGRHFFGVEDVKRYIDMISYYKMNVLHLHLSDDQGWRIEIKSWPNLTKHGGSTQVGGGKGGFYTQEQYKEIVAYAQSRYIT